MQQDTEEGEDNDEKIRQLGSLGWPIGFVAPAATVAGRYFF